MVRKLLLSYSNKFASQWLILLVDMLITILAFLAAYVLRFNFVLSRIDLWEFQFDLLITGVSYFIGYVLFNSFSGIVRHTSISDVMKLVKAVFFAAAVVIIPSLFLWFIDETGNVFYVAPTISIIHTVLTLLALISTRFFIKLAYFRILESGVKKKNVLIYGAGQSGIITKNTLLSDTKLKYKVVGYLDDNKSKIGKFIGGVEVFSPKKMEELLLDKSIEEVVISIQNISAAQKSKIIETCLHNKVLIKNVPAVSNWINGELSTKQIQNVKIDDLLQREPIELDKKNVNEEISGKVVLVTGAAGSIGSEIARQIMHYSPKMVVFLDQAESALYEIEFEIKTTFKETDNYRFVIADIRNKARIYKIFEKYKPEFVFHAAAYKHVPLMEENPTEGVGVNVFGTKNLADISVEFGVEKFVMVSTDKAVNPTNVMGATKRVAEIYTQSLNSISNNKTTKFITTRFGNVLGSNGSVIPLFRKQIERGGPVKVTHPDITRYFMTIPEACQLVLEAGAMGSGGEIFVFDMGESVKILDVAKKMIQLSGLEIGKDISIEITGLRPGEKLYEELLNDKEDTLETHHPKIMKGKVDEYNFEDVVTALAHIKLYLDQLDSFKVVEEMKKLVPEYKSQNSRFEKIDHKLENEI